ncbi:class I SAM-dependent methyltransferase [Mycobacterium sp. 852002-50816_SCH5313054-b]|uniref:class I SAM-dependent methyltransferase n=1 Tax=Mycobacterium sp. 852002-50816_SCH5313054-b TaxID=1834092 RepID=UPI0009EDBCE2|nr:class I SAM-dependent methyltransferase [Mycobacterium sp. 852002-50816_SCH5313054-b]
MTVPDSDLSRRRRELYESTAALYTATFHIIWRVGFPHVHAWLTDALHDRPVILDAGAGSGYWSRHIARTEPRRLVVAMDFSHAYVTRTQAFIPEDLGVAVVQGDVTAAPFPAASFDAILCSGVLDTMPDPVPALSELRRLLRRDGRLLLILRSRGSRASTLIEKVFRSSISMFRWLTRREGGDLDPELWSRTAISPRLAEYADSAGLVVDVVHYGRLLTRASLSPRDAAAHSKERGSDEDNNVDTGEGQDGSGV